LACISHRIPAAVGDLDDAERGEEAEDRVGGIDFEPAEGEVGRNHELVMIVLEQLTQRDDVEREGVPRSVVRVEVSIAVLVA
jgi:hypothetical protein